MKLRLLCSLLMSAVCGFSESALSGRVFDPQGNGVAGATVRLETPVGYALSVQSNAEGLHRFGSVPNGAYQIKAEAPGLVSAAEKLTLFDQVAMHNITLPNFALQRQSVVITASPIQPEMDMRNAEVFNRRYSRETIRYCSNSMLGSMLASMRVAANHWRFADLVSTSITEA